jgi:hypothetical protein
VHARPTPPCRAASMGVVKSVRHRGRKISKDLQADPARVQPESRRRARGTALCGYAARTSAIAQNPLRGNNYPGQCHTTPTGVEKQWRATRCRSSLGKSLHGKDLRPDRQHADEQRERRQRGGFFDHGPNHDPFLPTVQNENDVLFLFRSQLNFVPSVPNLSPGAALIPSVPIRWLDFFRYPVAIASGCSTGFPECYLA